MSIAAWIKLYCIAALGVEAGEKHGVHQRAHGAMSNPSIGSASGSATRGAPHSAEVDSLRAIAMSAVMAMHCKLLPFGWIGVWLFFVISGYVVTQSINSREADEPPMSRLIGFFRRRTVRIVPIYYLFVFLAALFTLIASDNANPQTFLSLVLFYQNISMLLGFGELHAWPVGHLWTISVEMQFYLIYGCIACLCSRRVTIVILIGFVIAAPIARAVLSITLTHAGWKPEPLAYAIYSGPGVHFDSFAIGALLALARNRWSLPVLSRYLVPLGFIAFSLYCVTYLAVNALVLDQRGASIFYCVISGILYGQGREIFLYTAVALLSLAFVVLALTRSPLLQWLLGSRQLQWIGTVSYGAYVYHLVAIQIIWSRFAPNWGDLVHAPTVIRLLAFLLIYGLTLMFAQMSYHYFELPLARYFNKRHRRSKEAWLASVEAVAITSRS